MKQISIIIILFLLSVSIFIFSFKQKSDKNSNSQPNNSGVINSPTGITATPTTFQSYNIPNLSNKASYTIILLGDSIIKSLGSNSDSLRSQLAVRYPDKTFGIFNYGKSSTNITDLPNSLNETSIIDNLEFPPILQRQYDFLIIESFGYNPLSDFPENQRSVVQSEILFQAVTDSLQHQPKAIIAFMTPIAPDRENFAKGSRDLTPQVREQWVDERISFIENHRLFAQKYGFPIINVFEETLRTANDGQSRYISEDNIHPSQAGVDLMAQMIADMIAKYIPETN